MTNPTSSRTKLKLELAEARKMHVAEEREEARRKEAERTAELRALRLAQDSKDKLETPKKGAKN